MIDILRTNSYLQQLGSTVIRHLAALYLSTTSSYHVTNMESTTLATEAVQPTAPATVRRRRGDCFRGVPKSEETKAKMRAAQLGKPKSPQHRRKLAQALKKARVVRFRNLEARAEAKALEAFSRRVELSTSESEPL